MNSPMWLLAICLLFGLLLPAQGQFFDISFALSTYQTSASNVQMDVRFTLTTAIPTNGFLEITTYGTTSQPAAGGARTPANIVCDDPGTGYTAIPGCGNLYFAEAYHSTGPYKIKFPAGLGAGTYGFAIGGLYNRAAPGTSASALAWTANAINQQLELSFDFADTFTYATFLGEFRLDRYTGGVSPVTLTVYFYPGQPTNGDTYIFLNLSYVSGIGALDCSTLWDGSSTALPSCATGDLSSSTAFNGNPYKIATRSLVTNTKYSFSITGLSNAQTSGASQEMELKLMYGDKPFNYVTIPAWVLLDDQDPVYSGCPADVLVPTATGLSTAPATWTRPTPSDNLGVAGETASHSPGDIFAFGNTTVEYVAFDASYNNATCSFTVRVYDDQAPVFSCPADIVVNTSFFLATGVVSWVTPTAIDNVDTNPSVTPSIAPGSTFNLGATVVTYTVMDSSSNVFTCSFTVTVVDQALPTIACPAAISIPTEPGLNSAIATWVEPTTGDNAGILRNTSTHESGDRFTVGSTYVTYTLFDTSLNNQSCTFVVTVYDNQNPTVVCPADIVLSTSAGVPTRVVTWSAPATTDNVGVASSTPSQASGTAFNVGTTVVTYTVQDAATNTVTCSFSVTIVDQENPVIICPSNIALNTEFNDDDAVATWQTATVTDNVGVTNGPIASISSGTRFAVGTHTVTYFAEDAAGNNITCSFTVTVTDVQLPTVNCPSSITQSTAVGVDNVVVTWPAATASDNTGVSTVVPSIASGSSFSLGTTSVVYTATDIYGNQQTCTFTVTITDNEIPNLVCPADITQNTDAGSGGAVGSNGAIVTWTVPTPTDNSGSTPSISGTHNPGSFFPVGTTTSTYTSVDSDGNQATCTFTITIVDNEIPRITCPADIVQATDMGRTTTVVSWPFPATQDNVGVTSTSVAPGASGSTFNLGATTVSYGVNDAAGNGASCSFVVTVVDQESPNITCPDSVILPTDSGMNTRVHTWTVPSVGNAMVADNHGILSVETTIPSGSAFIIGTTVVTYTATDLSYNNESCSFTVSVLDRENPILECPTSSVQATDPGLPTANVSWLSPNASDNVGVYITETTHLSGSPFPLGTTTVAYTARDSAGNLKNCTWDITVVDQEKPVVPCPNNVFILLTRSETDSEAFWPTVVATDNDNVTSLVSTHRSGDVFQVGNTLVTYTATDTAMNNQSCTFLVTISDFLPNITLDNHRTGISGTEVTVSFRPQYVVPGGGLIEIALPGFTGAATLGCSEPMGTELPACVDGIGPVSNLNGTGLVLNTDGTYHIQLNLSAYLIPRETYSFRLGGLMNPPVAGRTAPLGVITRDNNGVALDVNSMMKGLDIMSVIISTYSLTIQEGATTTFTTRIDHWSGTNDEVVYVKFNTSNAEEVIVVPHTLAFDATQYNASQTVTVYGIRDREDDGTSTNTIVTAVSTTDPAWEGMTVDDMSVTVTDIDVAGLTVSRTHITTSETGSSATFTVRLNTKPTQAVTVVLTSEQVLENTVSPASLTFNPSAWNTPQTVTVVGVPDEAADGDQITAVNVQPVSNDSNYNNMLYTVNVTNVDINVPAILVYPSNATTHETIMSLTKATFYAKLHTRPHCPSSGCTVIIDLASSDETEGIPIPTSLTFDETNWNTLQSFIVQAMDDLSQDGAITYQVSLNASSSSRDPKYRQVTNYVTVTNEDGDIAGLTFYPDLDSSPLFVTHERQGPGYTSQTMQFSFDTMPLENVTVVFTSSDPTQGYAYPTHLLVTPEMWANNSFNVTILGSDDAIVKEEDTMFTIFVTFETQDPYYAMKNYSFRAINLARPYDFQKVATGLLSVCVETDFYEFDENSFISRAAYTLGYQNNQINVDSVRMCTTEDQEGLDIQDQKWVKFKPQALTSASSVRFQVVALPVGTDVNAVEEQILNLLNYNTTAAYAFGAIGKAIRVSGQRARSAIQGVCPKDLLRYFDVTLEVRADADPYSPVSPVVWAVHGAENANPIWATQRYAVDPVKHWDDGLRKYAEGGNSTALMVEMAARKAAGHLQSYGVAYTNPSITTSPAADVVAGQKVSFGFYARPGDYLNVAANLIRSNDRFYGNAEFGTALFDENCNPRWGSNVEMNVWDAGTAKDQPFWANLYTGLASRQMYGTHYHLGQISEAHLIRQVSDAELLAVNDTYPLPADLLLVSINRGVDVTLTPLTNSAKNTTADIQISLPMDQALGNELRIEFPFGWFGFDSVAPTQTQILAGMDAMEALPITVIEQNLVKIQFASNIVLSNQLVRLRLNHLTSPGVCGELEYRVTTHTCTNSSVHGEGKYYYRQCSTPIVNISGYPPNGMPRGCDACNSCSFDYDDAGDKYYTCYTPAGTSFLRVNLPPKCATNPYSLAGYPFS